MRLDGLSTVLLLSVTAPKAVYARDEALGRRGGLEAEVRIRAPTGFDDLAKRLDVRDRVEKLETKMSKVETALNVRL